MSNSLLIKVEDLSVARGGKSVFAHVSFNLHAGEKIALVGRNGCGKSTLMKSLNDDLESDTGEILPRKGLTIGYLPQSVNIDGYQNLGDYGISSLDDGEQYLFQIAAQNLGLDPSIQADKASGGELRKASIAKLFAKERDLYLLDEPTNHLDIDSILWLENEIVSSKKAYLVVSHDRRLLANFSQKTFWLDRGNLRFCPHGFARFEDWQEDTLNREDVQRHKLDQKIKSETLWSIGGISARRKRNQGRLRTLQTLKNKRAEMLRRETSFAVHSPQPKTDSQMVLEIRGMTKTLGDKVICRDFSLRVMKGERIAIIGPNGAGKTTLLRCLTQMDSIDKGTVRLGYGFELAALWQDRWPANPKMSVQAFLVGTGANAHDTPDHVVFQGRSQHVVSYIKKFQFPYWQAQSPLKSLSGGEWGRILLAKILLQDSNFLALDEPTNDLDVETLDMLQDLLAEYSGTVVFISHDRDFIDKVAGTTISWEREGKWQVYAGGWSDSQAQKDRKSGLAPSRKSSLAHRIRVEELVPRIGDPDKLSFTELHRLESLPLIIEEKVKLVEGLNAQLQNPELYGKCHDEYATLTRQLAEVEQKIQLLEEEWYLLGLKAEENE